MALVMKDKPSTEGAVLDWIKCTFLYYELLAKPNKQHVYGDWYEEEYPADEDGLSFDAIPFQFKAYDVPVVKSRDQPSNIIVWRLYPNDARAYLQQRFGPRRNGTFPFLELPSELRSLIYNMVFQYPASGLMFVHHSSPFQMVTKNLSTPFSFKDWASLVPCRSKNLYTKSQSEALKPLLINKQVFDEAFPLFYRLNLFYFQTAFAAYSFLRRTAPYRRQHLCHLGFSYTSADSNYGPRLFDYLATLPQLESLHININETNWHSWHTPLIRGQINITGIPGLEKLKKVCAREVTFSDTCPNIAAYLKRDMEDAGGTKRKVNEAGVEAREQRGRAAKRVKKHYAD